MTDRQIAEEILELLDKAEDVSDVLDVLKGTYCLNCGHRSDCDTRWCCYDSVLESN